jgi:hypothetical protein
MSNALLPKACRCGYVDGEIVSNAVMCAGCGAKRADVSAILQKVLTDTARLFGELKDPVVLRRPDAAAKIKQQDEFLKRKRRLDGKAWFDIITENLDENFLGSPEDEIDPDPSRTGQDQ